MKVYRYYFQGRTKYTRATYLFKLSSVAQQNCLFLNKENVFNWLWTVYSNTYVSNRSYVKTLIQCQNTNSTSKPSEEVKFETSIAVTIIANPSRHTRPRSQLTLEVFPWMRVVLKRSPHFTPDMQSSVSISPSVCILLPVWKLQSAFYIDHDETELLYRVFVWTTINYSQKSR